MAGDLGENRARRRLSVVFLDVDGVLNSGDWFRSRGPTADGLTLRHAVDPAAMGRLNRLCAAAGAAVVVSSTWRKEYRTHGAMVTAFRRVGLRAPILGRTPDFAGRLIPMPEISSVVSRPAIRGDEIGAWLRAHPTVEQFVILDDDSDMGPFRPRLVQTEFKTGLTDLHVERALALFSSSSPVEGDAVAPAGLSDPQSGPLRSTAVSPSAREHAEPPQYPVSQRGPSS